MIPPVYTHDMCRTNGHIHVAPMETYLQMMVINKLRTAEDRLIPRRAAMATVMSSQTTHLRGRRGRSVRIGISRRGRRRGGGGRRRMGGGEEKEVEKKRGKTAVW